MPGMESLVDEIVIFHEFYFDAKEYQDFTMKKAINLTGPAMRLSKNTLVNELPGMNAFVAIKTNKFSRPIVELNFLALTSRIIPSATSSELYT